jgi:hypothetical protein
LKKAIDENHWCDIHPTNQTTERRKKRQRNDRETTEKRQRKPLNHLENPNSWRGETAVSSQQQLNQSLGKAKKKTTGATFDEPIK